MINAVKNTDKEIWREKEGDFYSDSIHVTKDGGIGINVSGHVVVKTVQKWHQLQELLEKYKTAFREIILTQPIMCDGKCQGDYACDLHKEIAEEALEQK